MDEAQLSQGHKPLRGDSLLFTNKFPEGLGITLMVLVLLGWSYYYSDSHYTHKKIVHLIPRLRFRQLS